MPDRTLDVPLGGVDHVKDDRGSILLWQDEAELLGARARKLVDVCKGFRL